MECQRHGFDWEIDIKRKVFGVSEEEETAFRLMYTSKWDIPRELNKIDNGVNISIKTSGSDTVCMGDAMRMFTQVPGDMNMCIVVFYQQQGDKKVVSRVIEWFLNDTKLLFNNVTLAEVEEFRDAILSFPKHRRLRDYPEYRAKLTDMAKKLNEKSGAMKFNRKLDSKTQRRLQCSISGFDAFITANKRLVAYDRPVPVVRGVAIAPFIVSGPRVFRCDEECGE